MLISVLVPVYNVASCLRRCLDSIVDQTFREYDLILIDDGSTDNSGEICDAYAKRYPFVHVIHQRNRGLFAARNAGVEWSPAHRDSQYLTFIDSDDWVHPQYLELLHMAIQQNGCGVAVGQFIRTNAENDVFWAAAQQPRMVSPRQYYCDHVVNCFVAWGKLYHKSDFAELRFPEGKGEMYEYGKNIVSIHCCL